jgi:hypothetical protein
MQYTQLYINAKEIATATGDNPYKSRDELICAVLERNFPGAVKRARRVQKKEAEPTSTSTPVTADAVVREQHDEIQTIVEANLRVDDSRAHDPVPELVERLVERLSTDPATAEPEPVTMAPEPQPQLAVEPEAKMPSRQQLKEAIIERVAILSGEQHETKMIDSVQAEILQPVVERNGEMRYGMVRISPSLRLKIGGRVDGYVEATRTVIEVKKRMNRLFRRVPVYEQIQVLAYLHLFDVDTCLFREEWRDKHWSTEIRRDEALWRRTEDKLKEFCGEVIALSSDAAKLTDFLTVRDL